MLTQLKPNFLAAPAVGQAVIGHDRSRREFAKGAFFQFQYDDLAAKSQDLYANTKYAILASYLKGAQPLKILNVGCGSGELSLQLAAKGHTVLGVDIEPAHIELANRNLMSCGSPANCEFVVSSAEDLQLESEADCVVSTDMLEHINDDHQAFAKMMNALKPGGLLLLAVPAGEWLFGYHDEQLGHFRRYTKKTLHKLVEQRCTVEVLRYFGFTLVPVCLLYSRWLRRPYPVAESGDVCRHPGRALVLRTLLRLDSHARMPFGTSLLMKGRKKA